MARLARQLAGILLVGAAAMCTSSAWACDVPVFRYALEYWPAAPYEVTVLHRAPLLAAEREALERLDSASFQGVPRANVIVRFADLTDPSSENSPRLWRDLGSPALPVMVLQSTRTPHAARPIWSGPVTASNARMVVDSPARREIVRRILEGHSAVWVLLESGDRAKDMAAKALLQRSLRDLEQQLELPAPQGSAPLGRDEPTSSIQPPLQLRFSLLTVSRGDAAESVLVQLLLNSEQDLGRYAAEPMVFPIYGRGRVLYALVGKGITRENLQEAGAFLVGACSCEAKEENPGTDLLMAADWKARLVGSAEQAAGPQPLVGLATMSKAARAAKVVPPAQKTPVQTLTAGTASTRAPAPSSPPPDTPPGPGAAQSLSEAPAAAPEASAPAPVDVEASSPKPSSRLLRNMLLTLGAIAVVTALLGVLAARRRPEARS